MIFSVWLANELKQRNMSQAKLSKLTKIDDATISRHLNGLRRPAPKLLRVYANALNIPVEKLYNLVGYFFNNDKEVVNGRDKLYQIDI